jgi:hypothetical protein
MAVVPGRSSWRLEFWRRWFATSVLQHLCVLRNGDPISTPSTIASSFPSPATTKPASVAQCASAAVAPFPFVSITPLLSAISSVGNRNRQPFFCCFRCPDPGPKPGPTTAIQAPLPLLSTAAFCEPLTITNDQCPHHDSSHGSTSPCSPLSQLPTAPA